jgi:hypothetical protein
MVASHPFRFFGSSAQSWKLRSNRAKPRMMCVTLLYFFLNGTLVWTIGWNIIFCAITTRCSSSVRTGVFFGFWALLWTYDATRLGRTKTSVSEWLRNLGKLDSTTPKMSYVAYNIESFQMRIALNWSQFSICKCIRHTDDMYFFFIVPPCSLLLLLFWIWAELTTGTVFIWYIISQALGLSECNGGPPTPRST